jgi:hypothetical protein
MTITMQSEAGFPAGTEVHADSGLVAIEQLRPRDSVWTRETENGERQLRQVLEVRSVEDRAIDPFGLVVEDSASEEFTYFAGVGQEFWVAGRGWTILGNLSHEERVALIDGALGIAWGGELLAAGNTTAPGIAWVPRYRGADTGEFVDFSRRPWHYLSMEEAAAAGIREVWAKQFRWRVFVLQIEGSETFYVHRQGLLARAAVI